MKRRFYFEDTTIADPNRQVSGIGPGARDNGTVDVQLPADVDKTKTDAPKILPFQISNSIPQIAEFITELMTMRNNLEAYGMMQDTPEHKKLVVSNLIRKINKINTIFAADVMRLLDKLGI